MSEPSAEAPGRQQNAATDVGRHVGSTGCSLGFDAIQQFRFELEGDGFKQGCIWHLRRGGLGGLNLTIYAGYDQVLTLLSKTGYDRDMPKRYDQ